MTPDKQVTLEQLLEHMPEKEAKLICGNVKNVPWHELARVDGTVAVKVLTDKEFDLICDEFKRQGLPEAAMDTREALLKLIWFFAETQCPEAPWYTADLHSAVACAALLRTVQTAWGFDEDAESLKNTEKFAAMLGVPLTVESMQ